MSNLVAIKNFSTLLITCIMGVFIHSTIALSDTPHHDNLPPQLKGYAAQYFSGIEMNNLLLVKQETAINYNWGTSSPASNIPADYFSVRFLSHLKPAHIRGIKEYTFYVTANDYVRFSINGKIIVRHLSASGKHTYIGRYSLEANQTYDLTLEYAEGYGNASIKLEWESNSLTRSVISNQYSSFTDINTDTKTDSDQDGIPDFWEIKNGTNPLSSKDAYLDKNQDGITNIDEYNNQTNWGNEEPAQKQDSIVIKGSSLTTNWQTPTHRIDGTKLSSREISSYIVSYIKDDNIPVTYSVRASDQNNYTFNRLRPGNYEFYIEAVDLAGLKSPQSTHLPVIIQY